MFVSPVAGRWLDTYDTAGAYTRIFGVLAVSAAGAIICALLVRIYKKKQQAKEAAAEKELKQKRERRYGIREIFLYRRRCGIYP